MSDIVYVPVERPHDPIHALICADAFDGKSTCAATFPKPILVTCFDAFDKVRPYKALGRATEPYLEPNGMTSILVYHRERDEVVCKIEFYLDPDPSVPIAWDAFRKRARSLPSEVHRWGTWIIDSVTNAEVCARLESMFKTNVGGHGKQHYGHSAEQLQCNLLARVAWMPINVVAIAHYDDEKDDMNGVMLRNPSVPGKMTKRMPAGFGEMYRLCAYPDPKTKQMVRVLQTQRDAIYNAGTGIGAPNGCAPHYDALWPKEKA